MISRLAAHRLANVEIVVALSSISPTCVRQRRTESIERESMISATMKFAE